MDLPLSNNLWGGNANYCWSTVSKDYWTLNNLHTVELWLFFGDDIT